MFHLFQPNRIFSICVSIIWTVYKYNSTYFRIFWTYVLIISTPSKFFNMLPCKKKVNLLSTVAPHTATHKIKHFSKFPFPSVFLYYNMFRNFVLSMFLLVKHISFSDISSLSSILETICLWLCMLDART